MEYTGTIWLTSDLHLDHDKEFIWKDRGFNSKEEMNKTIINHINEKVGVNDTLFVLGDVMLGDRYKFTKYYIDEIKCQNRHLIIGNHDTPSRIFWMQEDNLFKSFNVAAMFKHKKWLVYLSHFPTLIGNYDKGKYAALFGHTHQVSQWEDEWQLPTMYNVGVDAHNCYPISLEQAIENIRLEVQKNKQTLLY